MKAVGCTTASYKEISERILGILGAAFAANNQGVRGWPGPMRQAKNKKQKKKDPQL